MGLFDLPAPLLGWLDAALIGRLPAPAALAVWGAIAAAVSMAIYALVSPQARIAAARDGAGEARRRLLAYDGDFDGYGAVAAAALGRAFAHFGLVLGPVVVASLPVLAVLTWADGAYGRALPAPGTAVTVTVHPPEAAVVVAPEDAVVEARPGALTLAWPTAGEHLRLSDAAGRLVATLPPAQAVTIVHKRAWWNWLFANPAGYVPADSAVETVEIALASRDHLGFGPSWLRGWEAVMLVPLLLVSIAIKIAFRIH